MDRLQGWLCIIVYRSSDAATLDLEGNKMDDESGGPYMLFWTTSDGRHVGKAGFVSKELRAEKTTALRADNPALEFEERDVATSSKDAGIA